MKKSFKFIFITLAVLILFGCSQAPDNPTDTPALDNPTDSAANDNTAEAAPTETADETLQPVSKPRLQTITLDSAEIAGNPAGYSSRITMHLYLPPSYYTSDKHYPVVYYLHGYSQSSGTYALVEKNRLDRAFEDGAKEFIVVDIEGRNSFYVNSPATGNWEDYIIKEAIPLVDKTYRTLAQTESRGICGFSMGGFGSMYLALRNPDVFSAVYSVGPGMLAEGDLQMALDSWKGGAFMEDYARAFAPDLNAKNLGNQPKMDGSEEDKIIVEQWESGFGNLKEKIAEYQAKETKLKAIAICYGTRDSYEWIPRGTQSFSDLLNENGIEHTLFVFDGGHNLPPGFTRDHLVPFFNEALTY